MYDICMTYDILHICACMLSNMCVIVTPHVYTAQALHDDSLVVNTQCKSPMFYDFRFYSHFNSMLPVWTMQAITGKLYPEKDRTE
jgi:hypothetical protein